MTEREEEKESGKARRSDCECHQTLTRIGRCYLGNQPGAQTELHGCDPCALGSNSQVLPYLRITRERQILILSSKIMIQYENSMSAGICVSDRLPT